MFGFMRKENRQRRLKSHLPKSSGERGMMRRMYVTRSQQATHVHTHMPACPKPDKQRLVISLDDFREIPETPVFFENEKRRDLNEE